MFKNFLSLTDYNEEDLLEELIKPVFNEKKVEKIFSSFKCDINWRNKEKESFLHLCSKKGLTESMKWLLKKGAKVNLEGAEGNTALFYALETDSFAVLKMLIDSGAEINQLNDHKRSLLQEATITCNEKLIDFLFSTCTNVNNQDIYGNNLIFDAIANGSRDIIKKVADIESININHRNKKGNTVLHKDSVINDKGLAIFLMEIGVSPTVEDNEGKNFLFYAIKKGIENLSLIEKALELGCDINCKDHEGETLLHQSVKYYIEDKALASSHLAMIQELLNQNITINAINDKGENVLFELTKAQEFELIEYLLDEGIFLDQKNERDETVFGIAVMNGIEGINLLMLYLNHNISTNIKNIEDKTPIEILIDVILFEESRKPIEAEIKALMREDGDYLTIFKTIMRNAKINLQQTASHGKPLFFEPIFYHNKHFFKIFKDFNVNLNAKDDEGNNIILALMERDQKKLIPSKKTYLLTLQNVINLGADINVRNIDGVTPLLKAALGDCEYTFRMLLSSKADCYATDINGRTIVHNCVWDNKVKYFKHIAAYNREILDIPDKYGVQPINYAAFMGKKELVIAMLDEGVLVNNTNEKDENILKNFKKYHENVLIMEEDVRSKIDKMNLKLLKEAMIKDFFIPFEEEEEKK